MKQQKDKKCNIKAIILVMIFAQCQVCANLQGVDGSVYPENAALMPRLQLANRPFQYGFQLPAQQSESRLPWESFTFDGASVAGNLRSDLLRIIHSLEPWEYRRIVSSMADMGIVSEGQKEALLLAEKKRSVAQVDVDIPLSQKRGIDKATVTRWLIGTDEQDRTRSPVGEIIWRNAPDKLRRTLTRMLAERIIEEPYQYMKIYAKVSEVKRFMVEVCENWPIRFDREKRIVMFLLESPDAELKEVYEHELIQSSSNKLNKALVTAKIIFDQRAKQKKDSLRELAVQVADWEKEKALMWLAGWPALQEVREVVIKTVTDGIPELQRLKLSTAKQLEILELFLFGSPKPLSTQSIGRKVGLSKGIVVRYLYGRRWQERHSEGAIEKLKKVLLQHQEAKSPVRYYLALGAEQKPANILQQQVDRLVRTASLNDPSLTGNRLKALKRIGTGMDNPRFLQSWIQQQDAPESIRSVLEQLFSDKVSGLRQDVARELVNIFRAVNPLNRDYIFVNSRYLNIFKDESFSLYAFLFREFCGNRDRISFAEIKMIAQRYQEKFRDHKKGSMPSYEYLLPLLNNKRSRENNSTIDITDDPQDNVPSPALIEKVLAAKNPVRYLREQLQREAIPENEIWQLAFSDLIRKRQNSGTSADEKSAEFLAQAMLWGRLRDSLWGSNPAIPKQINLHEEEGELLQGKKFIPFQEEKLRISIVEKFNLSAPEYRNIKRVDPVVVARAIKGALEKLGAWHWISIGDSVEMTELYNGRFRSMTNGEYSHLWKKLEEHMELRNVTGDALARRVGGYPDTFNSYAAGSFNREPTINFFMWFEKAALFLGVSPRALYAQEGIYPVYRDDGNISMRSHEDVSDVIRIEQAI